MNISLISTQLRNMDAGEVYRLVESGQMKLTDNDLLYILEQWAESESTEDVLTEALSELEEANETIGELKGEIDCKEDEYLALQDHRDELQKELDELHLENIRLEDKIEALNNDS